MTKSNISTDRSDEYLANSDDITFTFSDHTCSNTKKIDFDKVETLEDVINILQSMEVYVYNHEDERYDDIRHLLTDAE